MKSGLAYGTSWQDVNVEARGAAGGGLGVTGDG
jgi:hypothetical protein